MEAICSSETSVDIQRTTRRYIPKDGTLQILYVFVTYFCIMHNLGPTVRQTKGYRSSLNVAAASLTTQPIKGPIHDQSCCATWLIVYAPLNTTPVITTGCLRNGWRKVNFRKSFHQSCCRTRGNIKWESTQGRRSLTKLRSAVLSPTD
jgi:hypothetical protein